jgi:hypothetical protein
VSLLQRPSGAPLRRRDFLALSSVAAGAALWPRAAAAQQLQMAVEPLSVGFLEDSDRLENVFELPWRDIPVEDRPEQRVVPAEALTMGDSAMAFRMVRIKIHGLYPSMPPARFANFAAAHFTIFYHVPWLGLVDPLPFHAWGGSFGPRPTQGAPLSFVVPTREDGSLEMSFDIIPARKRGIPPRRAVCDFTVDPWPGRPKLQRGIYLLGFDRTTFMKDQQLAPEPRTESWDMLSLAMSVEKIEEEEGEI